MEAQLGEESADADTKFFRPFDLTQMAGGTVQNFSFIISRTHITFSVNNMVMQAFVWLLLKVWER